MKERPIIFSGPMVRAILEGRKTQTRRVIKPQPPEKYELTGIPCAKIGGTWTWDFHDGIHFSENWGPEFSARCPYGRPGDLLWVRETWSHRASDLRIAYKAGPYPWDVKHDLCKWRSSIHMPKKYARLWLRITNVRVERVQEITEEDAKLEGIEAEWRQATHPKKTYRAGMQFIWDSLNAKRGYPWESNPYVWVVEFEKAKP